MVYFLSRSQKCLAASSLLRTQQRGFDGNIFPPAKAETKDSYFRGRIYRSKIFFMWDSNGIFPLKWPGGAHPAYPFGGLVRSPGSLNEPFLSYEPAPGPSGCHASTYTRHHTPNTAHFFHLKKAIFGVHPRSFDGHFRPLGVGNQQDNFSPSQRPTSQLSGVSRGPLNSQN